MCVAVLHALRRQYALTRKGQEQLEQAHASYDAWTVASYVG